MNFRTEIHVKPADEKISLAQNIFTIGSCFADAIGSRLQKNKFNCQVNPFGILYNPISIHKALRYAIDVEHLNSAKVISRDGTSFHFDFHSALFGASQGDLIQKITDRKNDITPTLKKSDFILITYGTAWVYKQIHTNDIVANCHKVNASEFTKSLLTVEEITASFSTIRENFRAINPAVKFILTISPVRHVKDTLSLNSVSKSVLRVACHEITERHRDVEYFPAYEMMVDDLRDYRFYKTDMLHPTEQAEDYIWEKFMDRFFSEDTKTFMRRWNGIQVALAHKPFHPKSPAHQQFLLETRTKLEELKSIVDVSRELAQLNNYLDR